MKKRLIVILALALTGVVLITGCGKNNDSSKSSGDKSGGDDTSVSDVNVGEQNQTVSIDDYKTFESELDIRIDAEYIENIDTMYIVDEKIAEINFIATNVEGEEQLCTLRGTRDESAVNNLHAEYEDATEPVTIEGVIGNMAIEFSSSETVGEVVYTWSDGNIYYAFTCSDSFSQIQIGEILDSLMIATGFLLE